MLLPQLHLRCYAQETASHQHDNLWQIIFGLSGSMEVNFNREDFLISSQNCLIIPPTIHHAFSGNIDNKNLILELPATSQWQLTEKGGQFTLSPATIGLLEWLHQYPQPPEQYSTITRLLLAQMEIQKNWRDNLDAWLANKLHTPLTTHDIALAFNTSASTLQRKIKAELGISVMQYVTQYRLSKAAELLKYTATNIESIALAVGYDSHSAFSQVFRQYYNKSPTEYRQR
ncbi:MULTISPECIES: AraC family transcriptional regulator [Proteus]|uniref:Transcriptional regulator n=1 Tax=Proteus vulgaris TaxID=585 RepID=A0A379F4E4_PROVU|nr:MULTISPECIES: AraC family transcriptional regulator [Proteus]NBN61114.1 helix-turn-helix domain-containing protein [Proteus sp. G2639]RNT29362.1 AraC family transcriptional regulator [Proteus mirabilis]AYY80387.1 AraC family transcriptional regulator [Proteus vulgaris]KGA59962.1 cupin domain protein [Proteus vulgaris]MBG5971252.1 helix-turn-helix domain-containing protein [Proteus vulgaris]